MKISNAYNPYSVNDTGTVRKKPTNVKEYSNYLAGKFGCLTPSKNVAVSVTGGLLRKAMSDEKTGEWLERELSKAPDYIKAAQQSCMAHGGTLKSVSIEFGEEYSTMTTVGVFGDEGGTDSEIDKWLEKIKERKEEQKEADKKIEQKKKEQMLEEKTYKMEFRGEDIEDLTEQFAMRLSGQLTLISGGAFDVRG